MLMANQRSFWWTLEDVKTVGVLLAAPLAWTLHLLLSYLVISAGCAYAWNGTRIIVITLTVVLAGVSLASAYGVYRSWPRPVRLLDWAARAEPQGPSSAFLRGLGLIVTGVFTLAILLGGFGTLVLPLCAPGHH